MDWYINSNIEIDPMITYILSVEEINRGFDLMPRARAFGRLWRSDQVATDSRVAFSIAFVIGSNKSLCNLGQRIIPELITAVGAASSSSPVLKIRIQGIQRPKGNLRQKLLFRLNPELLNLDSE